MSIEGRSSVDRGSIEVSIATIDRHSIAGVISTHDTSNCGRKRKATLSNWRTRLNMKVADFESVSNYARRLQVIKAPADKHQNGVLEGLKSDSSQARVPR